MDEVRLSIFLIKKIMGGRTNECWIMPIYSQRDNFNKMPFKKQYTSFYSDMPKYWTKPVHLSEASSHVQLTPENERRKQGTQELCEVCKTSVNWIWIGVDHFYVVLARIFALCAHTSSDMSYPTACARIIRSMYKN